MPTAFPSTLAVPPESQTTAAAPSEDIPASAAPEEAAGPSAPSLAAKEDASESAAAGPSAPTLAAREQARGNAAEDAPGDEALTELEREAQGAERLEGVARLASQVQPKGHTLDSAGVHIQASHALPGLKSAQSVASRKQSLCHPCLTLHCHSGTGGNESALGTQHSVPTWTVADSAKPF